MLGLQVPWEMRELLGNWEQTPHWDRSSLLSERTSTETWCVMYIRTLFPGIPGSPAMGRVTRSVLVKTLVGLSPITAHSCSTNPYHRPIVSTQISFTLFQSYWQFCIREFARICHSLSVPLSKRTKRVWRECDKNGRIGSPNLPSCWFCNLGRLSSGRNDHWGPLIQTIKRLLHARGLSARSDCNPVSPVHKPSNAEKKTLISGSAYCFILWSTLYEIIFHQWWTKHLVIMTKMSVEHEFSFKILESASPDLNVMEWSSPSPLCGCIA